MLSALLIIVAMLSILIGAVMTELTGSFLTSRTLVTRMQREATVTSAVELGINQLKSSTVPAVCARDSRGPWYVALNGYTAAVTQSCSAILPDVAGGLAGGAFPIDGVHDTATGRNRYLIGDSSGRLYSYPFGQTALSWSLAIGGALTASPLAVLDASDLPDVSLLVPVAKSTSGCGGHCVALFEESTGTPAFRCDMGASATVKAQPAAEVTSGGSVNFPTYVFFGDSGGNLYVFDASSGGGCNRLATAGLGGSLAGAPLVFPGRVTTRGSTNTTSDEIFAVVTSANSTSLEDWRYSEAVDSSNGDTTYTLSQVGSLSLSNLVGGNAVGYAISSTVPSVGAVLSLAVAGASGRLAIARIAVASGPSYTISTGANITLPGGIGRPPLWCHCPGEDLIGAGGTNGVLYILNPSLVVRWSYDGQVDGRPAINTTPVADANGDWYFGADDGYVYDVEIPFSGMQLFKAARFGPGGAIRSSPIVGGAADGCSSGLCLYFGSNTAGSYFVKLGSTRIIDLRACLSSTFGSTSCSLNPRLWARVEVGLPAIVGARGVYVQGWSYYSP